MAVGGGANSNFDIEKDLPSFPLKIQYVHKQTVDVPKIIHDRLEFYYNSIKNLFKSSIEVNTLSPSTMSNLHGLCLTFINYSIDERVNLPSFITNQFCKKCSCLSVPGITLSSRLKQINKKKKNNKNKKVKNELVSVCLYCEEVVDKFDGIEKKKEIKQKEEIIEEKKQATSNITSSSSTSNSTTKISATQAQKQAAIKGKISSTPTSNTLAKKASTFGQNFTSAPKFSFNMKPSTTPSTSTLSSNIFNNNNNKRKSSSQDSPDFISLSAFSKKINTRK